MKKTYINPKMEVIKMEIQQVIAASIGIGAGDKAPSEADTRELEELLNLYGE